MHQRVQVGDFVEYQGEEWYVVHGPIMSTQGSLFELSKAPPNKQGVPSRSYASSGRDRDVEASLGPRSPQHHLFSGNKWLGRAGNAG